VTKDAILCRARFAHKPVVYRKNDVAALILPPSHSERYTFIAGVAFTAVCIVSSFFVPAVPVAIGLRIAAGLPPAVLLYLLFFTDKITEDGSDHNDDILLYQKPNVPLQINLRS
jgi:cobalamin biosynthesis protein CobD/CbiB